MNLARPLASALAALLVTLAGISPASVTAADGYKGGSESASGSSKVISFGRNYFDPLQRVPASNAAYRTSSDGRGLRFVQFQQAVRGEWLSQLEALGARPLQYYPHDTFLVWADDSALQAVRSQAQVRWVGDYAPDWKLEPDLEKRQGLIRNVGVHFHNDGDLDAILAALEDNGARLLTHSKAQADGLFHDAWIEVEAGRLYELARLPQVVWLEYASPEPILDDEMSSQIVARNYTASGVPIVGYLPWLATLGYDGSGLIWAVIDSGIDYAHPDFAGRIVGGVNYGTCPAGGGPGDDSGSGGHGTHVAGIVGGSGAAGFSDAAGFNYGYGIAPGVGLFAQNPICNGSQSWPPAGGWQRLSRDALLGGAIGANGSWTSGESGGTTYTAGARVWDQIIRNGNFDTAFNDAFMMVFSAGNSGPSAGTLTAPKAAKNPIVTGGTQNYRVSNNIDAVYNSSSRGPTQDGRYGITVAAPAQTIASARRLAGVTQCSSTVPNTSNTYSFCTGTSMAAPHVSGAAVILSDWWRDMNGGAIPSPAMIKALLINGARDYGGGGAIPNTTQGWGRIDLPGSLGVDFKGSEYVDQSMVFTSVGEVFEFEWAVLDSSQPLKVSLAWTDAAAAAGANPTLVNDLDLEVITGGQTYLGNVFSGGVSVTGGSADNRNNEENVFVAKPGNSVTIRVIASNLPGDGIPGNGIATDQDFALVCRNCAEGASFSLSADPVQQALCVPDSTEFELSIGSILGYDEAVTLALSGQPAGMPFSFTSNPLIPPGSSTLQLGPSNGVATGSYALNVLASSIDQQRELALDLQVFDMQPAQSLLLSPENGASDQPLQVTLQWTAVQASSYRVQVASSPGFTSPVLDELVAGNSLELSDALLEASVYYWRVQAQNGCGNATWSPTFTFSTLVGPGACPLGSEPEILFAEDFTDGVGDFTTEGSPTWALSTRPGSPSGGNTMQAVNLATVGDQRLISPPVALPEDASPLTLQFWNDQTIERRTQGGCWDAGILEISTNNGANWTQVTGSAIVHREYDGQINSGYSNPLSGLQGWCGDPRPWENYIIDLDQYAGQSVRFRWRLGTDSTVGRPDGWHVDDIKVQACNQGSVPAGADLALSLFATPQTIAPGGSFSVVPVMANFGPQAATGLSFELSMPAGLSYVQLGVSTANGWDCSQAGGLLSCSYAGVVAAGIAPSLDIQIQADPQHPDGNLILEGQVSADQMDPQPLNNAAEFGLQIVDPDRIFAHGFE